MGLYGWCGIVPLLSIHWSLPCWAQQAEGGGQSAVGGGEVPGIPALLSGVRLLSWSSMQNRVVQQCTHYVPTMQWLPHCTMPLSAKGIHFGISEEVMDSVSRKRNKT